ncbi:MAG: FKBP-type peptidyl-prolyl cis-trans isomerase, partial [Nitrosomonas sp.]|uniref:FKBP-type peptidyl-prolyl cis-trans isomerase n=1 Tax=Nitrosomonas sp. TaxID=42353 RepID=UPI002AB9D9EA
GTQKPTPNSIVEVHYEGTFLDGRVFDSSIKRNEKISFPLNRVIPAWTQALCEMVVGDRAIVFCPSDTAYGARGAGPIPGIPIWCLMWSCSTSAEVFCSLGVGYLCCTGLVGLGAKLEGSPLPENLAFRLVSLSLH